jgi:D-glycero-D-manno-heptose 1,7-bisphosphate phosphatase
MSRSAVFLDRDGVLVPDVDLAVCAAQIPPFPWTRRALAELARAGFARVVVTNQPVVARGLISESQLERVHAELDLDVERFYFCPHHPSATLPEYRAHCECRKPRPGMLLQAARELDLDLARSYMIGDRASDVEAGRRAGCTTIRVLSGAHAATPIQSPDGFDPNAEADLTCADLREAVALILERAA